MRFWRRTGCLPTNAEYDAQLAQFYSRTIAPGAVDNYQAKLFGWEREPSET
jgi:hypothetical protein